MSQTPETTITLTVTGKEAAYIAQALDDFTREAASDSNEFHGAAIEMFDDPMDVNDSSTAAFRAAFAGRASRINSLRDLIRKIAKARGLR